MVGVTSPYRSKPLGKGEAKAHACDIAWFRPLTNFPRYNAATMSIGEISWLDFVGFALTVTLLEAAMRGVGTTVLKGHRNNWQVARRFRPILGLAGMGLLVLVAAHVLTRFNLLPRR